MLAYLALHVERAHSRESLAEWLWPDSDPSLKRTRLRQEIASLRSAINKESDSGPLIITRADIRLNPNYCTTDLLDFTKVTEQAKNATGKEREALLTQATALYRADLLASFLDHFVAERTYYAHRFEDTLQQLAESQQSRGDDAGAIATLQRLVQKDPLREEAHAALMRLFAAAGQTASVRRQYDELERATQAQLNEEPSESIRNLYNELREQSAHASIVQAELPVPPSPDVTVRATTPRARNSQGLFVSGVVLLAVLSGIFLTWFYQARKNGLQRGTEAWTYQYTPGKGEQVGGEARAIGLNSQGTIFVTGYIATDTDDADILTFSLDSDGKQRWVKRFSSPGHDCDRAYSLAIDSLHGDLYVGGETYIPKGNPQPEGWYLTLIKYSESGELRWVVHSPITARAVNEKVKVYLDGEDGVFLAGTAEDASEKHQILLARYRADGTLLWHQTISEGDQTDTLFYDMVIGKDKQPTLCGTFQRGVTKSGVEKNGLVARFSATGERKWLKVLDNPGDNSLEAIARGEDDCVYVGGILHSGDPVNGGHGKNLALAKYDSLGTLQWKKSVPESGPTITFSALAVDEISGQPAVIAGKKYKPDGDRVPFLASFDRFGNQRSQSAQVPPDGFRQGEIAAMNMDARGELLTVGEISNNPGAEFPFRTDLYLTYLNADGTRRWQRAYDGKGEGADCPRTMVWLSSFALVGGHTALPNTNRPIMVSRYNY